jgi:hypothetical protein
LKLEEFFTIIKIVILMNFIYNDFSNFLTDLNEYQKRFNNHYYKNNTEEIK